MHLKILIMTSNLNYYLKVLSNLYWSQSDN